MGGIRLLIIIGQVGSIWSKSHKAKQVFRTATAIGFFSLFILKTNEDDKRRKY